MSLNKVMIIGRLGQDPELKHTPTGTAVCNFSVATSESWNDKSGQKQEKTEWHRVVVWNKLAELCNQYLNKGKQVFVEGKLQTRSWDDKDGQKKYTTEILASTVQFLSNNSAQAGASTSPSQSAGGRSQQAFAQNEDQASVAPYQIDNTSQFASDDIPF